MSDTQIGITLTAIDNASAGIKNVGNSLSSLNSSSAKTSAAAGSLGNSMADIGRQASTAANGINNFGASSSSSFGAAGQAANGMKNNFDGAAGSLGNMTKNMVAMAGGFAALEGARALINSTIGSVFEFEKSQESTQVGFAAMFTSMTRLNGAVIPFNQAMDISKNVMAQLNQQALLTGATTGDLAFAFRSILGPALQAQMTVDQIIKLATVGSQAVRTMLAGTPNMDIQIVQELRSLVSGNVVAGSMLAKELGITSKDVEAAKQSADGLFKYLMDRLQGFQTAAPAYLKTWEGIASQIKSAIQIGGGEAFGDIFNDAKIQLGELANYLVTFNRETNKMEVNPELVATFKGIADKIEEAAGGARDFWNEIKGGVIPAVSVLGSVLSFAAENSKFLLEVFAGYYTASKIIAVVTGLTEGYAAMVAIATAGLVTQEAAAVTAGVTTVTAAGTATVAEEALAGACAEVAAAELAAGEAAVIQGAETVGACAAAEGACTSLLVALNLLRLGWLAVAVAAAAAAKAVIDYQDNINKVKSYNDAAEVYDDPERPGMHVKKQWAESESNTDEDVFASGFTGNPSGGGSYVKVPLSEQEEQAHNEWLDKKNNPPKFELPEIPKLEPAYPHDDDGKKGKKGKDKSGEIASLTNRIDDSFDRLNTKITEETGTTYQLGMAKISDEMDKMQREIVEKSQSMGIDTSALESKMTEYASVMKEKVIRAWKEAWTDLKNQTALGVATLSGDKAGQAAANEAIALAKLDDEKKNRLKKVEVDGNDEQAKLAVEAWYTNQVALLAQKRADAERQAQVDIYNNQIEQNGYLVAEHKATQTEIDKLNRQVLDKKILYLQEELKKEGLTADEILAIHKELADAQTTINNTPLTNAEGIKAGLKNYTNSIDTEAKQWQKAAESAASSMNDAFSDMFFDTMQGKFKSLGDYIGSFLQGVQKAISQVFAQQATAALIKWILPGHAAGGRAPLGETFIAGERGPELISLDGSGASITSAGTTASKMGNGGSNVVVNVINQTSQEVTAQQSSPSFDELGNMIIDVVLSAVATNKKGMRTALAGAR